MALDLIIRANQATGAYRRVQFEDFAAPAPAEPLPAEAETEPAIAAPAEAETPAEETAPDLPSGPLEIAPGVHLPTAEEVERIHQDAYKAGYDIGYEEGSARGRLEASELHQLLTRFDETLGNLDEAIGSEILALSLEVARLVVRDHIARKPESLIPVLREALAQLPQQHGTVHIHSEDAALVKHYLSEHYAHVGHRVVEDDSLERGDCRIEIGGTQLDATAATRWRRVVENLSTAHPWSDD
ncbi:FliH/SctL family protein [Niveibacterium sp. 24ML]|uniref:FliH/SctL family protein n=1 Tax=Niveibacterium sp. 24ML TaxID=2985512 RepID=UPI002270A4B9|nr:FliH/SctL family protein [Niveibacterium sp. 24ML]MCX9157936.1 FliH/SctL family protein [Niveibacterium sp. 24ML]